MTHRKDNMIIKEPIEIPEPINFQDAVDLAVKEGVSVFFKCTKSNDELRKIIASLDEKDCVFGKPHKESNIVDICPKSIHDLFFG